MGSHFHHGHVSRGPPIIPDGRISQVRFETLAYPQLAFPCSARFKRWFAYAPASLVCPPPRSISFVGLSPALSPGATFGPGTAKCPESLCPMWALPNMGETCCVSWEGVTPPSSLLRTHAPIPSRSPVLRLCLVKESLPVATSPGCEEDLPDVISANLSLDARPPATAVPQSAYTCFFLCVIGLPQLQIGSASRNTPLKRLLSGASFRSCRHSFMFGPPSLLAPQVVPTAANTSDRAAGAFTSEQNMLRYLRMHRIC
jgi:hypothetical protein